MNPLCGHEPDTLITYSRRPIWVKSSIPVGFLMSLFRNLASATFKDDGTKDLADFVSIMVSTAFMLTNCLLCISVLFAASFRKGIVETNETEGLSVGSDRRPVQLGWR